MDPMDDLERSNATKKLDRASHWWRRLLVAFLVYSVVLLTASLGLCTYTVMQIRAAQAQGQETLKIIKDVTQGHTAQINQAAGQNTVDRIIKCDANHIDVLFLHVAPDPTCLPTTP